MAKELEEKDIVVGNTLTIKRQKKKEDDEGYPFGLTHDQVVKLIYFYGSRRATKKMRGAATKKVAFSTGEKRFVDDAFEWFGFAPGENFTERNKAYMAMGFHFKEIQRWLKKHPAFITTDIHEALNECGFGNVLKNIVLVVDENRNIVPRVINPASRKDAIPLAQAETLMWEFQNIAMDKLMMIVRSIDPRDLKKATLGGKAKALRDIGALLHMQRSTNRNPNMALININVGASDSKEKLQSYNAYITKNREGS